MLKNAAQERQRTLEIVNARSAEWFAVREQTRRNAVRMANLAARAQRAGRA